MTITSARAHASPTAASISALAIFLAIALATLEPYNGNPGQNLPWCLVCGPSGAADVLRNVVMFVPYGAALRATRMRRAFLLVVATTVMIELMQYRVIPGREGTLSDVLTNAAGGAIGMAIADRASALLRPSRRVATWLAALSGGAVLSVMLATVLAFQLSMPLGDLEIQWAPTRSPMVPFRGRVGSVRINGRPTRAGEVIEAGKLALAGSREVRVEADVALRGLSSRTSAIVRAESSRGEALLLGTHERDVMFTPATRAMRWRLNAVGVVLGDALPTPSAVGASPMRVWGSANGSMLSVEATTAKSKRAWSVPVSPALGWTLVSPFYDYIGRGYQWMSLAWLFALWLPVGYWAAWAVGEVGAPESRRAVVAVVALVIGVVGGLAVLPRSMGVPAPLWTDWLGATGGAAGGWVVAIMVRARAAAWRGVAQPLATSQSDPPPDGQRIVDEGDELEGGQPAL